MERGVVNNCARNEFANFGILQWNVADRLVSNRWADSVVLISGKAPVICKRRMLWNEINFLFFYSLFRYSGLSMGQTICKTNRSLVVANLQKRISIDSGQLSENVSMQRLMNDSLMTTWERKRFGKYMITIINTANIHSECERVRSCIFCSTIEWCRRADQESALPDYDSQTVPTNYINKKI